MLKLNEEAVKSLPSPDKGNRVHYFAGAVLQGAAAPKGFGVRVTAAGAKAFVLNYRHQGTERRYTIGAWPDWSALLAVREARSLRQRIDRGEDIQAAKAAPPAENITTVSMLLNEFIRRHLEGAAPLRSALYYKMAYDNHVRPQIGDTDIKKLARRDIVKMLDHVADTAGPVAAERTKAYFRSALSWYADRTDDLNIALLFGKSRPRVSAKERARTRVLSDEEIRLIWPRLAGTFGALVKTLLLTAQRRDEVANMARGEIGADGIWTIPAERYKSKRPNHVPLSALAREIIDRQWEAFAAKGAGRNRAEGKPQPEYVFHSSARTAFSAFSKGKRELDAAVSAAMQEAAGPDSEVQTLPNWTLHDLRRTAKTLMSRAGVRPDISERVLGHVIAGVEGVYDRHAYADEKRDALERLSASVAQIVGLNTTGTAEAA